MIDNELKNSGKSYWEIKDWSTIKYVVRCHWGVHVDKRYPYPVIEDRYFENFTDVEAFVQWYETVNQSINKKIIYIMETGRFFNIETYEVATKVRIV